MSDILVSKTKLNFAFISWVITPRHNSSTLICNEFIVPFYQTTNGYKSIHHAVKLKMLKLTMLIYFLLNEYI